jgi:hypothetical protein
MKNLLIYTGPNKQFDDEHAVLVKIQIDNSLDLGWKKEDILLVTDFAYEYNGVKALVIEDGVYYPFDKAAGKVPVISHLLGGGFLAKNELYWSHDLDAYELNAINEAELGLENFDLGLTHYGYKPQWQCTSFFFKDGARDIFALLDETTRRAPQYGRNNEKTLTRLIDSGAIDNRRYKRLNVTYNIAKRCLATIYAEADKPLKVLHFRPSDKDALMPDTALNMFMHGKNRLKIPLMNDRLIKIFKSHGIQ